MITLRFLRNVLIKGVILFLVLNLIWAGFNPAGLGKISAYNLLFRGRDRFPFGENPSESYNLSLYDFDAMFASLRLDAGPKPTDEFRVFVIGDSSTWGTLLRPEETLAGQLDAVNLKSKEGKTVRVYNLGYPTLSLLKDVIILEQAMEYSPDLILWPVTLESFPRETQQESPIVVNNPERVAQLVERYDLNLPPFEHKVSLLERTLAGQRRPLADLIRLQLYGVLWSATGIDQVYPADFTPAARDLEANTTYHNWTGPSIPENGLALDVLATGLDIAGDTPVVLINEPILISPGVNSNLRYNFYYPRWVYDQYRQALAETSNANSWYFLDLWDLVPQEHFTNSAIHLDPSGEELYMQALVNSGLFH